MKFETLKRRVERREQIFERRAAQTENDLQSLKSIWRRSWTPGRIVSAGLLTGFLLGNSPSSSTVIKRIGRVKTQGGEWLQVATSVSGLLASFQAAFAANKAKDASHAAEDTAQQAQDVAVQANAAVNDTPVIQKTVVVERPPYAAEAATEVSELTHRR